jgi:hypothetical protein
MGLAARRVIFDAARAVLADGEPRLAGPLLPLVDDRHCVDAASLRFLVHLGARLDELTRPRRGHGKKRRSG